MSRISMPSVGKAAGGAINNKAPAHRLKYLFIGAIGVLALAACGNAPGGLPDGAAANHPHARSVHGGGDHAGGGHGGGHGT